MAVPTFQDMMLPFLRMLGDRQDHTGQEVMQNLIRHFSLTEDDINDLVPSGNQTRLSNRMGWCRTHLKNAGLIEYVRSGVYRITERGTHLLASPPAAIDLKFLDTYPEHREWFHREPERSATTTSKPAVIESTTPEEQIAAAMQVLDESLKSELLDQLHRVQPVRFEQVVLDLLVAMGYGGSREEAARRTKASGDEGIDGVINEDRLGLDSIYVQAKRWQGPVGRPDIQGFVGALAGAKASKGVFITTSRFSQTAIDYAEGVSHRVILIDGHRLADLMIEHGIGVSTLRTIAIKRLDSDYFASE